MTLKHSLIALCVVIFWGINFSVIKIGLEYFPPLLFSSLRFLVIAIPAIFFIPFPKTPVRNVIAVGFLLGVFKFALLFLAMRGEVSAGLASLILQAQVFFTIALCALVWKESISRVQLSGLCIASLGFGVFFFTAGGNVSVLGLSMILAAALFWASSNLIMKSMQGVNLMHFMVWVSVVPPVPLFLLSLFFESASPHLIVLKVPILGWISLAYVSYISTLLAFALWGDLLKKYAAALVTPFALLIPVVGMITAWIWLGEQLLGVEMIGAACIMFGLVWSTFGHQLGLIYENRTD